MEFFTKILFHREHITESSVLKTNQKIFQKNINFMTTAVVINNFQKEILLKFKLDEHYNLIKT
jgi:hypothetical protein